MTYDQWADEYLESAKATYEKIQEYEKKIKKCRSPTLLCEYNKKLDTLYDMYYDCLYSAKQLERHAERCRKMAVADFLPSWWEH